MANRFDYMSTGAAMAGGIEEFLVAEGMRKRQAMLDKLAQERAERENQMALEDLAIKQQNAALQREQAESLRMQREETAAANRMKRAQGVASILRPESEIDTDTAEILRQGGMGALVDQEDPTLELAEDEFTAVEGTLPSRRAVDVVSGEARFTGTPEQQMLQAILADTSPETKRLRDYLRTRNAVGGEAVPYQLFEEETKDPVRGIEVLTDNGVLLVNPVTGEVIKNLGKRTPASAKSDADEDAAFAETQNAGTALDIIGELRTDPGIDKATGAYEMRGWTQEAVDFNAKRDRLVALLTLPNLGVLKGPMSDKDVIFVKQIATTLANEKLSKPALLEELKRAEEFVQAKVAEEARQGRGGSTVRRYNPNTGKIE